MDPETQRVLVIDDDPILRELLSALLSADGYTAESAATGEEGLARLRAGFAAHAILADIQLPGLAGPALAAELRQAAPGARLLCMSASEAPREAHAAFDVFLLKPFSIEDFAAAFQAVSRKHGEAEQSVSAPPAAPAQPEPLDADTYDRLARSLPHAQLAELYRLTFADIDSRLDLMRASRAGGDAAAYRREAHALKGGCAMVGAVELARLAARAEAGSFGDTPALEEFTAAVARLRSIMTARSIVSHDPQ